LKAANAVNPRIRSESNPKLKMRRALILRFDKFISLFRVP
jgi:hypothetical protein